MVSIFGVQASMSRARSLQYLVLMMAFCAPLAISQSGLAASPKTTPPGVGVELATVDGRTTYHMGEEVGLVTRYRSAVADRYVVETAICGKYTATADIFNRNPGKTQPIGSPFCYHLLSAKGVAGRVREAGTCRRQQPGQARQRTRGALVAGISKLQPARRPHCKHHLASRVSAERATRQ